MDLIIELVNSNLFVNIIGIGSGVFWALFAVFLATFTDRRVSDGYNYMGLRRRSCHKRVSCNVFVIFS